MKMFEGEEFRVVTMQEFPQLKGVQVSNYGRVKRGYYILNKKKRYNASGYEVVYVNEVHKELLVHRIVADTFHPEGHTPEAPYVDHVDGNKKNNRADNLEWVSCQENNQRYCNTLDRYERRLRCVSTNIIATDMETKMSTIYPSMTAAGKELGIDPIYISDCINNNRENYKKYKFFKLGEIKGIITDDQDGIQSGLNRQAGYWAQANFDGYSIRVNDTDMARSTKQDLVQDVTQLKEIIERKLHEGDE